MNQFGVTREFPAGNAFRFDGAGLSTPERTDTDSSSVLTIIGTIASQVVLITALFYYFGWVYAHSFFGYFGIEPSLVGYSTADYALRSINVAFRPFIYLTFAALVLFGFHRLVMAPALMRATPGLLPQSNTATSGMSAPATQRSAWPRPSRAMGSAVGWVRALERWRLGPSGIRWIIRVFRIVAIALALAVFAGMLFPEQFGAPLGLFLPLLLMLSVGLLGYIAHVCSRYAHALAAMTPPWLTPPSRAYTLTLLSLGMLAGLWAVSIYGDHVGTRFATDFAAQLPTQPGVVIYSTERIALNGPGIDVREIAELDTKYHYQYTGLRFLARSPDKFLLVPSRWQHDRDRVLFLRDDNTIRIDILAR